MTQRTLTQSVTQRVARVTGIGPKSLFDPVAIGLYQDGDIARQRIASEQGPKHVLIQGMTGSGKTQGEMPVLLTCAARGAVQVIVDVRKKTQSYGSVAPVLDWLITDDGAARSAITRLADKVIPARTEALAKEGRSSWHPDSSLRLLRFQVEEAWDFVDEDELTEISLAARSAGVHLIVSVQRGSHDMMSTSLRDQLGTVKCYGLRSSWGASLLDDDVEDAGAAPQKWADEFPGMAYLQQGGLPLDRKATPYRAYTDSGRVKFADVAASLGPNVARCDMVTAAAWGDLYRNRRKPTDLVRKTGTVTVTPATGDALTQATADVDAGAVTQPTTIDAPAADAPTEPDATPVAPGVDATEEDDDVELIEEPGRAYASEDGHAVLDDRGRQLFRLDEADPEPGFHPDIDDAIGDRDPAVEPVRFGGDDVKKATREEFDRRMEERLVELLESEERDLIRVVDFADVVVETRWSRGTVYNVISDWVDASRITRVDDGWVPVRD